MEGKFQLGDTHTQTHRHTHRHTDTHTDTHTKRQSKWPPINGVVLSDYEDVVSARRPSSGDFYFLLDTAQWRDFSNQN